MRLAALRYDVSGYVYYRQRFILDAEKSVRFRASAVCKLKNMSQKYHIIEIASWRIVTERNAQHETDICVGQPKELEYEAFLP